MALLDILWRHMKLQVVYSSAAEQNQFKKEPAAVAVSYLVTHTT
jgi:hypothetical protein